ASVADALLSLQCSLACRAVLIAAQIAGVLVEGDRCGSDEACRRATPPHRVEGGLRRHLDAPDMKRRQRPASERQVAVSARALLLPLRDEAQEELPITLW